MGKSTRAERIETRDGVGYLYGGKIYTEKEYDSVLTGQGVDGNAAFASGGKKSSISKKNVTPAGEELMRGVDTKSMTAGPKQTPAPTGEISLDQKLESFKDKNPQFYADMKAGKTEGWNEIIKNEVPYGNTGMPNSTDVMKEIVSQISTGSGVLKTLSGTSQSKPGLPGGNLGVLTVDKETGNDIITLPKQSAGETNANSYIGTQKSPIGSQPTTTTPTTSTGKTQKYMGKEAPVIESDTFSNAMRKFASSNQDPTGKVFYWNGKAYKYEIGQTPNSQTPKTQTQLADKTSSVTEKNIAKREVPPTKDVQSAGGAGEFNNPDIQARVDIDKKFHKVYKEFIATPNQSSMKDPLGRQVSFLAQDYQKLYGFNPLKKMVAETEKNMKKKGSLIDYTENINYESKK
jgi:hypothetical protein